MTGVVFHPSSPQHTTTSTLPILVPTTEIQPAAILAASQMIPEDRPVFMLNLLRYKERAVYGGRADLPPCSGREAYFGRYVPAFQQVVAAVKAQGVKPCWLGSAFANVVAPAEERWDDVAIVEYPRFAAFRQVVESPEYQTQADPHRRAALADWRLIATTRLDLPS